MLAAEGANNCIKVRRAVLADVTHLHALLAHFARQRLVLPRSPGELFETLRDFHIAEIDADGEKKLVGGCALHLVNGELAEIKSLVVADEQHGLGIGRRLVEACHDEARSIGLQRTFCLTNQDKFFTRLGYTTVDRARLPEKVWGECVRCDRFLACDEIAMWFDLDKIRVLNYGVVAGAAATPMLLICHQR